MKSKYISGVNIQGTVHGPLGSQQVNIQNASITYVENGSGNNTETLVRLNLNLAPYRSAISTEDTWGNTEFPQPCTKCGINQSTAISYTHIDTRNICYCCVAETLDALFQIGIFKKEKLQQALFTPPQK